MSKNLIKTVPLSVWGANSSTLTGEEEKKVTDKGYEPEFDNDYNEPDDDYEFYESDEEFDEILSQYDQEISNAGFAPGSKYAQQEEELERRRQNNISIGDWIETNPWDDDD